MDYTILETDRLILRPYKETDFEDFCEYFLDKEINSKLGIPFPSKESEAWRILKGNIKDKLVWAIELKETGKVIGDCHFGNTVNGFLAHIGYVLNKEYQRKGYAFEAVSKIIEYASRELGFKRIRAISLFRNRRSVKLLERLGFEKEALIYEAEFCGRIEDVVYYSRIFKLNEEEILRVR